MNWGTILIIFIKFENFIFSFENMNNTNPYAHVCTRAHARARTHTHKLYMLTWFKVECFTQMDQSLRAPADITADRETNRRGVIMQTSSVQFDLFKLDEISRVSDAGWFISSISKHNWIWKKNLVNNHSSTSFTTKRKVWLHRSSTANYMWPYRKIW